MTLSTTRGAMFRAVLEGIAINLYETARVLEALLKKTPRILIGGGGVRIAPWGSIIADVFGQNLFPLPVQDASSLGAAMIGAYGMSAVDSIYQARPALEASIHYRPEHHIIWRVDSSRYIKVLKQKFSHFSRIQGR